MNELLKTIKDIIKTENIIDKMTKEIIGQHPEIIISDFEITFQDSKPENSVIVVNCYKGKFCKTCKKVEEPELRKEYLPISILWDKQTAKEYKNKYAEINKKAWGKYGEV